MKKALFCVFATAVLGGCATVDSTTPPAEREEAVYRTGSNIPTRQKAGDAEGVKTYDREALDRARSNTAPAPRPGIPGATPGG
jgi:uncharacterized protein YceK